MGGSSSQPRTDPLRSSINALPIKDLYTPEFLKSLQENTSYGQEHNPYEAMEIAFLNFNQGSEGSSKRHKSSGSSSFNTESRDASINPNISVVDEDDVHEIRRRGVRDKARAAAKNKGSKPSGLSTMNDDALGKLVVNEMIAIEVQQREAFIEIKMRKVECHE
nr:hypothetical protein [Tanacetum cinerariifolium]